MKKGIYVPLSCAILTVAALSGCSTTNKIPDTTIENAIQDSTNIYSDYGLSIQQLSFDSRNYDKQEKTEAVTVTVNADNADTSYTATYDVLGKLSDKSWRIVSVTQTSEEIKPKNALSYEDVSLLSDNLIKDAQGSARFTEACTMHIQDCTIDSTSLSDTASANLIFSADTQCFSVKREGLAIFNYTLGGWTLSDCQIGDFDIELNESGLSGTWSLTEGKSYTTLTVNHTDGSSAYATYDSYSQSMGYVFFETHVSEVSEFKLNMEDNLYFTYCTDDGMEYQPYFECTDSSGEYRASFTINPENSASDTPTIWAGIGHLTKQ